MAFSTGQQMNPGKLAVGVAFVLAGISFAHIARAETRYVYQTRYTKYPPTTTRVRHVAVKLGDGSVGVFGGSTVPFPELFDPNTERFVRPSALGLFGDVSAIALPDGRALVVGHEQDCLFDFETQQYVRPQNRYGSGVVRFPVLVPLPDGQIFICGGWTSAFKSLATCAVFDSATLQFRTIGQLQVPRANHTAVALDDHRILIAGGYLPSSDPAGPQALDALEIFDTRTGLSSLLPLRLGRARQGHCSVLLPDQRVLFFGGWCSAPEGRLHSTEIFDPNTNWLTPGPNLGLGRSEPEVAVLPSGRIAVFGGDENSRAVEVFCPQTGTWVLADCLMLDPRWGEFTATTFASGTVLLVGGRVNGGPETVPNAEIFTEVAQEVNVPDAPDEWTDRWCVELWDGDTWQSTVWLKGYDCPEYRSVGFPHPSFTAILRATEEVSYTRLVARFSKCAPYDARVRLFNLVGWTRVPEVVLGPDLDARPPEDVWLP